MQKVPSAHTSGQPQQEAQHNSGLGRAIGQFLHVQIPRVHPGGEPQYRLEDVKVRSGLVFQVLPGSGCPTSPDTHPKFIFFPALPEFASQLKLVWGF